MDSSKARAARHEVVLIIAPLKHVRAVVRRKHFQLRTTST